MRLAQFFITRPIFAAVLSLLIVIAGGMALFQLPVSEYPSVAPPTVVVTAAYPGANPKVIAETVAGPLEQQLNGIEGLLYMFSQSTADGRMQLTITSPAARPLRTTRKSSMTGPSWTTRYSTLPSLPTT